MKKWLVVLLLCLKIFPLDAVEGTVVALHGFLSDSRSMRFVAKYLRKDGISVTLWNYSSRERIIQEHAANLICCLQKIAAFAPGKLIHFIAHSTSSLILRAATNLPGFPYEARIGKMILLAPPNKGSILARRFRNVWPVKFAFGNKCGRQLMDYDECKIIEHLGTFPTDLQILVITGTKGSKTFFEPWVPNDGLIAVYETALEVPYYSLVVPYSHSELLTERPVLFAIRNFLLSP